MKKFLTLASALLLAVSANAKLTPVDLRCDYAVNPLGVDSASPRLFLETGKQRARPAADGVSNPRRLVREKSGRATTAICGTAARWIPTKRFRFPTPGKELKSSQQVFWKVRVWDKDGKVSAWSKPATWTMGVLQRFGLAGAMDRRGGHEHSIAAAAPRIYREARTQTRAGQRLRPRPIRIDAQRQKGRRRFSFARLDEIRQDLPLRHARHHGRCCTTGKNAVGIELGNGMYNVPTTRSLHQIQPARLARTRPSRKSGSNTPMARSNSSARMKAGALRPARSLFPRFTAAKILTRGWCNAAGTNPISTIPNGRRAIVVNGPGGELRGLSCAAPPIRFFEIHKPVASRTLTNGDMVFDLGQNAAHVPQISVSGPAGSRVRIIPAELIDSNGSVDQGSMGVRRAERHLVRIHQGDGRRGNVVAEIFLRRLPLCASAMFSGQGRNEIARRRNPSKASSSILRSEPVGEFECSNTLFNRIRTLVRWAQRSNMMSVMTDCPHREKLGWLEQDHLNGPALRYEFDLAQLFTKTLNDMADSQLANGLVPTTAPEYTIFRDRNTPSDQRNNFGDSPEWGSAFILVPWQQYEFDGDLDLFRRTTTR